MSAEEGVMEVPDLDMDGTLEELLRSENMSSDGTLLVTVELVRISVWLWVVMPRLLLTEAARGV